MILDVSNYDFETFDVNALKAAGVTGVILGCQNRALALIMATNALAGGLPIVGVYGFDYFGTPGNTGDIDDAIDIARLVGVEKVWIDCEADARSGVTPAQRIAEIHECVAAVRSAGLRPGLYTGRWWWVPNTNDSHEFADLPLWHSEYWDDHREVRTVDYGGWADVAVHQYTSTLWVAGRNRDANHVFEEDAMTPAEKEELAALRATVDFQARQINQLQTQLWGENPAPLRDAENPYAKVDMMALEKHVATHGEGHSHQIEVVWK